MAKRIEDVRTYLLERVKIDPASKCWIWQTAKDAKGYGRVVLHGERFYAHRSAYETFVGPIPEGLQIDHLCRRPSCVNPAHLEPVTAEENIRRGLLGDLKGKKLYCKNGHLMLPQNYSLKRTPTGVARRCLPCASLHTRAYNARRAAEKG